MPSQERKPMFLSCVTHSQVDLRRAKPIVAWNEDRFISQICFMINHTSWGRRCCLGKKREIQYGAHAWEACRTVQYNKAAKKESSLTKDSLPSQNTKMISSILISQKFDENKSKESTAAFPMQSVINQFDAYHMNQSLANHSSVNINRAFILLPKRLGIQISSDNNIFGTDSDIKEEKQCNNRKKGFASITITARRVILSSKSKLQVDASSPSCLKCQGSKLLGNSVSASNVTRLDQLCGPLHAQGYCRNQNATEIKVSEPCPQLCKEQCGWNSSTDNKENRMVPPGKSHHKEAPSSFTSSVHLSISQQCPRTIYYVDKSLTVPVDRPQTTNQKMHRSVVSFKITCSSPSLTPDGVDGLANGKLITQVLKTRLPEDSKTPLKAIWNADLTENDWDKKQTLETESLGTAYLWKGTSPSETLSVVDSPQGLDNLRPTNSNDVNSGDNCLALSPHIPHWTYSEGAQAFSGSNRKQCTRDKYHETTPASFLLQPSKKEFMVEGRISSKDRHLPKGTSESKESQSQSFPKPKISISDQRRHIKSLSKTAWDENDNHREDPFPRGDYKFCGSAIKLKEHKKTEENETVGRVTTSTAHEPDVPHEKHDAFQQPGVCSEPEKIPANPLTLREALEVHKPHFISHSQERLKKLEYMVQLRKAQQGDASGKKQGAVLSRKLSSLSITSKKKQFTVPHPLSDNLFKPKERFISEKEMHMRSKRIYNNLPEVRKKQEEKQKRVILQSNRMRAEVFKKQLLDQLLQRNTE